MKEGHTFSPREIRQPHFCKHQTPYVILIAITYPPSLLSIEQRLTLLMLWSTITWVDIQITIPHHATLSDRSHILTLIYGFLFLPILFLHIL